MSKSKNSGRLIPCMPPFLEQEKIPLDRNKGTTKFGGTACEHAMVMFLLSQITNCAEPYVDEGVDLSLLATTRIRLLNPFIVGVQLLSFLLENEIDQP